MGEPPSGPFDVTLESVPFLIVPGLVLLFTLGPAAAPAVPLLVTAFFAAALGAAAGMLVYRRIRDYGPMVRIGALTLLCVVLWGVAALIV